MSLVFPERIDSSGKIEYPSYTYPAMQKKKEI